MIRNEAVYQVRRRTFSRECNSRRELLFYKRHIPICCWKKCSAATQEYVT